MFNWVSMCGSVCGLESNKRQAISCTNDDKVGWCSVLIFDFQLYFYFIFSLDLKSYIWDSFLAAPAQYYTFSTPALWILASCVVHPSCLIFFSTVKVIYHYNETMFLLSDMVHRSRFERQPADPLQCVGHYCLHVRHRVGIWGHAHCGLPMLYTGK